MVITGAHSKCVCPPGARGVRIPPSPSKKAFTGIIPSVNAFFDFRLLLSAHLQVCLIILYNRPTTTRSIFWKSDRSQKSSSYPHSDFHPSRRYNHTYFKEFFIGRLLFLGRPFENQLQQVTVHGIPDRFYDSSDILLYTVPCSIILFCNITIQGFRDTGYAFFCLPSISSRP